eukprot:5403604-Pyramimonas_sp.AAC.1
MWSPFWTAFEGCDIQAHKTLAQATSKDIEAGRTTVWEKKANSSADQYAKLGACLLYTSPSPRDRSLS